VHQNGSKIKCGQGNSKRKVYGKMVQKNLKTKIEKRIKFANILGGKIKEYPHFLISMVTCDET
jgi:hypothetical protein